MNSRRLAPLLIILTAISTATAGAAEEGPSRDDVFKELSELIPPGTITESHVMNSNGFTLEYDSYKQLGTDLRPNGNEFQSVTVSASGAFKAQVVRGISPTVENGVSVYHRDSGTPLLALADTDGDGRPDLLTYSMVDASGQVTMSATDYDMDGQPDLRIHFSEHYFEIWHADRWYRVESRAGRRGIVFNGKFVELRKEKNRWHVP